MRTGKRMLAIILAVLLVLSNMPAALTAHAAEIIDSGKCGNSVTWTMYDDGNLVFSGSGKIDDNKEHIVKPWTSLYGDITRDITFESGIGYIGQWLLNGSRYDYHRLESVTIPSTVYEIGTNAFLGAGALREVHITSMEKWCQIKFNGDAANPLSRHALLYLNGELVEDYRFSAQVTEISDYALKGCASLRIVTIPGNIRKIGSFAFNACFGLEKIIFEGNAPAFGENVFTLDNVYAYYPKNNSTWDSVVTQDYNGAVTWVAYDPATEDVHSDEYPGGDCMGYTTWTLDENTGVLTISGRGRMYDFSQASNQPWDSLRSYIREVVVQEGVKSVGKNAFNNLNNLTKVSLPSTLETIGEYAFSSCEKLNEINLPENLTEIGSYAFYNCESLKRITVPGGVENLPDGVFRRCLALETVTLNSGLKRMGYELFAECSSLKAIVIPAGVSNMGSQMFRYCRALKDIWFEGDCPEMEESTFETLKATAHYPGKNELWTESVRRGYGGEITWDPYGLDVKFVGASLSLKGDIGLNFYAELSDEIRQDGSAYIKFTGSGDNKYIAVSDGILDESDGSYRFSVALNAKNMGDEVMAQGYNAEGAVDSPKTLSIKYYADYVVENDYRRLFINLMKAMLNYGAAAQVEFGYNTDQLVNENLKEADKVIPEPDRAYLYAHTWSGEEEGLEISSASLLLQSQTKIRIYFKLNEGYELADFVFTVDGKEVTPVQSGSEYYIEKPNVAAKDLDTMYTFCLGGKQLTYCGLSYVNQVMTHSNDEDLRTLAKALYQYNRAANGYFWNEEDDANLDISESCYVDEVAELINEIRKENGYPELMIHHHEFALVRAAELKHVESAFRPGFEPEFESHWINEDVAVGFDDPLEVVEYLRTYNSSTILNRNGITHIAVARNGDCWVVLGGCF